MTGLTKLGPPRRRGPLRVGLAVTACAAVIVGMSVGAVPQAQASGGRSGILRTFHGDQTGERFGFAISQLRDIDHDGVTDVLIGAPYHRDDAGTITGHLDVYSGGGGRLIYRFEGQPLDSLGYAMADAGDVDGDRIADIVVGAPGVSTLACVDVPRSGAVEVYSGRDGHRLLRVARGLAGDQFGAAVGSAGDVNRDGHSDLVIGAPCHDGPGGVDSGRAYVVSGLDGRTLRTHDGVEPGDGFGWGTAGLGDITGDRVGDYVVGAKDAGPGDRGIAYVYEGRRGSARFVLAGNGASADFGWFFVATAGDVDGDHRPDIYVGDFCAEDNTGGCATPKGQAYVFSGRTGQLLRLFVGDDVNDGAGPGRSAGDVDRDGRADVAVGLYTSSQGAPFAGEVIVYSGRTGAKLFDFASTVAGETLGYDAVGIGDTNRDGRSDLLVSAATLDTVYVIGT